LTEEVIKVSAIEPFTVSVPQDDLDDLRARLLRTRWPDQIPGTGWDAGTDQGYLQELCDYWAQGFDWRRTEAWLNRWPQFRTTVDGQQIHFIHARSEHSNAIPLLLLHGWPGSVLEFVKIVGPLVDPTGHGGRIEDAFHVVCMSLPGFTFSGPTGDTGWHSARMASAAATLMRRIGYDRFGVQGGDWGASVASCVAEQHPEAVIGLHVNFVLHSGPQPEDGELTPQEVEILHDLDAHLDTGTGYQMLQRTKPQTLAYGLNDSPAGLAGWIVEKFHAWTDGDPDVLIGRDEMLANITAYWLTQTAGSAARIYFETHRAGLDAAPLSGVDVPTGCAVFPHEIYRGSRRWAERVYRDIRRWTELPRGGHFAALERPEELVSEIRAFFATLRDPSARSLEASDHVGQSS
jgi:microsomal epoxide hydrolase